MNNLEYKERLGNWLSKSNQAYQDHIFPVLHPSGCLINCETSANDELKDLDLEYGIDFIQAVSENEYYLYSTRINYDMCYPSITLRMSSYTGLETEYQKRLHQFQSGSLSLLKDKYFTLHAYATKDLTKIFKIYKVQTFDLVQYVESGGKVEHRKNPTEGNGYIVINIDDLKKHGIEVEEWTPYSFNHYQNELKVKLNESILRAYLKTSPGKLLKAH